MIVCQNPGCQTTAGCKCQTVVIPYVKNLTYEQYNAALLARDDKIERLQDALNGCVDWIKENSPGPAYPYCVTEAEAAIRGIRAVT